PGGIEIVIGWLPHARARDPVRPAAPNAARHAISQRRNDFDATTIVVRDDDRRSAFMSALATITYAVLYDGFDAIECIVTGKPLPRRRPAFEREELHEDIYVESIEAGQRIDSRSPLK